MSGSADWDAWLLRHGGWAESFELLVGVVGELVAAQGQLVEAVGQLRSDVELLAGLVPAPVKPERGAAGEPAGALRAQAHESLVQSGRLVARARELAGRAQQLQRRAQELVGDEGGAPARGWSGRARGVV